MTSQVTSQTRFTPIPYPDWLKTYMPISTKVEEPKTEDFAERDFQARYAANQLFGKGPENAADQLTGQGPALPEKYKITQCTAPTANSPAIIVIERFEPKKAVKRPRKQTKKPKTTTTEQQPKKPKKQPPTKKQQQPPKKKVKKNPVKIAAGSVLADN